MLTGEWQAGGVATVVHMGALGQFIAAAAVDWCMLQL
jgi:hypothetical protein